jgi:hypothetical protein
MTLQGLENGSLELAVDEADDRITVRWQGKANTRRPAALLRPFFDELVAHAARSRKPIEFRMAELEHISSSTIVVVVQLVKRLEEAGVRLAIEYDEAVGWQRMTFGALSYLCGPEKFLELRVRAA